MSLSNTPQHPFERREVIRALVESQNLSSKDLLALSLTNKTILKLVYQETRRLKIKTTAFINNRSNPLWCYIELDDAKSLKTALGLAEFETDTTSLNGRLLRANDGTGIHLLMKCCIEHGSARCLDVLMKWADDPASPFRYDADFVYELARTTAFTRGRLECLLALHDGDTTGRFPPSEPTFIMLLVQARSPAAVAWLARRLPRDTDYLTVLVELCSFRTTQPAVVEAALDLVTAEMVGNVHPTPARPNTFVHAVAAAASVLHLPLIEMLLRKGPKVFFPTDNTIGNPVIDETLHLPNPLHCAVSHPLPTRPEWERRLPEEPPHLHKHEGKQSPKRQDNNTPDKEELDKLKHNWLRAASHTASSILLAAHYLLEQAFNESEFAAEMALFSGRAFEETAKMDRLMPDLRDGAAVVYLHHLRVFLLGNLRWLLQDSKSAGDDDRAGKLRAELLREAKPGRKTAWSVTDAAMSMAENYLLQHPPKDSNIDDQDDEAKQQTIINLFGFQGENNLDVTWQPNLSGTYVHEKLAEQEIVLPPKLEEVWCLLATPTTRDVAGRYLKLLPAESVVEREEKGEAVKFDMGVKKALLWELLVAEERGVDEIDTTDEKKEAEVEGGSSKLIPAGGQMKPGLYVEIAPRERPAPMETDSDSEWETVLTPTTETEIDEMFWTE